MNSGLLFVSAVLAVLAILSGCGPKPSPMVLVPAGEFMMGMKGHGDEEPVHRVYLDVFYIDKYEVTFAQYDAFCSATKRVKPPDSGWGRANRPVVNVSWEEAMAYCEWAGKRLPTEAEWEKAGRAGSVANYSFGEPVQDPGDNAWYLANSGGRTHPVGGKNPNAFGLYDMHGNVWEWCSDWFDEGIRGGYYRVSPLKNPRGPLFGRAHVLRGGAWNSPGEGDGGLRPSLRAYLGDAGGRSNLVGCRCAKSG